MDEQHDVPAAVCTAPLVGSAAQPQQHWAVAGHVHDITACSSGLPACRCWRHSSAHCSPLPCSAHPLPTIVTDFHQNSPVTPLCSPKKILIDKNPPLFAPKQQPAKPRFFKPKFEIVKAQPSPKPAKVKIIKVKEPKIVDKTVPFKNNEKFPFPEFNKVKVPLAPKPAKVKIIKVKEPKIIDNTVPFKNNEKFPKPEFRKINSPAPMKIKVITPKVVEAPIKDITKAPPKVRSLTLG